MKHKYYVVANVDKEKGSLPHSAKWPKLIGFSFENMSLLFLEGKGHGLQGGVVSINKFNRNDWNDFFVDTNSKWFLDFISKQKIDSQDAEQIFSNELIKKGNIEIIEY